MVRKILTISLIALVLQCKVHHAVRYQYTFELANAGIDTFPARKDSSKFSFPLIYKDSNIIIGFSFNSTSIKFSIRNQTKKALKVIWDEAVLVVNGQTSSLFHSGIQYIQRANPQAPTIIPPNGTLADLVMPKNNVNYGTAWESGWVETELFPITDKHKQEITSLILSQKGTFFDLYLPLQITDKKWNYAFKFKITDVTPVLRKPKT